MSSGHIWAAPEIERCKLCGDKDWMADKYCSGNPEVKEQREQWLIEVKQREQDIPYPVGCKLCNVATGCDGSC